MPVLAVLEQLNEEALMDILVKPKNAITKQYQKLFSFEDVMLTFTDEALRTVAKEAIRRNTGARGLRGVIEEAMLDTMFEIPSQDDVKECIISKEVILKQEKPKLVYKSAEDLKKEKAESA